MVKLERKIEMRRAKFEAQKQAKIRKGQLKWERRAAGRGVQPQVKPRLEEERTLAMIRENPSGIKLVVMGEKLGMDWRKLIPITKKLIDEGKIVKKEGKYLPT
ncbi:MAG: hypothetical protein QMC77_07900 [Methanocellales archaeon]|nr:hypothetical protein [Methanocellales archaeon]